MQPRMHKSCGCSVANANNSLSWQWSTNAPGCGSAVFDHKAGGAAEHGRYTAKMASEHSARKRWKRSGYPKHAC
eukprot:8580748-Alexandrium_andersonii.AAC.1